MIPGKRGFALLPVLIILASVLIGTGSVLVLRERMEEQGGITEEQGTRNKEQEEQTENNTPVGVNNYTEGRETSSKEQENEEQGILSKMQETSSKKQEYEEEQGIREEKQETNSNHNPTPSSLSLDSSQSIYLEGDNDGKDELNLGKTLKIKGGEGIKTSLDNNTITITNTGNTSTDTVSGTEYAAGNGINIQDSVISVIDSYDDDFLIKTTNFGGDVLGVYDSIVISDDSHSHTASTLPTGTSYLGQTISSDEITNATIQSEDFKNSNSPSDGQVLSYNQTTGGFTWINSSGTGTVTQVISGNGLTGGPINTTGTLSINAPTCTGTQKLSWNGSAFVCGADIDTDSDTTYSAGTGLSLGGTTFSIDSTYDDNFLTNSSSFGGDVSGAYNSIAVTDDSHNHTGSTISGVDISSDTNLSGDTEIVLTGDALSIASSITRDSEIASFITDGNTGWDNSYGFITDGNSGWDNSYGFITASSSDALTNKTGNISMWTNDSGYITDGNTNWNNSYGFITEGNDGWDNTYGFITDGNTGWDNTYGFITSVDFSQINNGSGIYMNYKPNNTACGLNQVLKYDTVNNRWICGDDIDTDTDTDTDTNNYPTSLAFSGTTTKTLTLQRQGLADLTAQFTDIDTDTNTTYSAGTGLSLGGTTFSIDSTYDDNFLTNSSSFGGDVSGAYNSIAVANDSHSHTASTIPSHDSITGAGTIDTSLEVQGVSVGGDASGSVGTITIADDSHNHTSSTISGIDISSDTNLSGDTEIVLTGDALSIASSITRDSEIASFITDGNTGWDNSYGFITDGNSGWDNSYGFITASSSDALTNKTGNISMWTNDANFITLSSLSSSATGLTYTNTTGAFSLTSGYVIPTTTQESNWNSAFGWGNHSLAGYITDGNTNWDNSYGYITDGNTGWDNSYNFITTSNVSGTTNYISKFTGANTVGNSQIFDDGTNVGIGTTEPTSLLDVAVDNSKTMTVTSDLTVGSRSIDVFTITQPDKASSNSSANLLQLTNNDIDSTSALLDIRTANLSSTLIKLGKSGSGTGGIGIDMGSISSGYKSIDIGSASGDGVGINMGGGLTGVLSSFTGDYIKVNPTRTFSSGTSTVTDSGNILDISRANNVASAGATFNVTGDVATFASNATQTLGTMTDNSNILELNQQSAIATGAVLNVLNSGTGPAAVFSSGNVGIGTTAPTYKLDVNGDANIVNTGAYRIGTTQVLSKGAGQLTGNLIVGDGGGSLLHTTGSQEGYYNTAVGIGALNSNTIGYQNSAIGYQSLLANTTGHNNAALGFQSLVANTTGYKNVAIGAYALYKNTIGSDNSIIGYQAGYNNISGSENTAQGLYSLNANVSGEFNTAQGYYSMAANTTGSYNVAIGIQAGRHQANGITDLTDPENSIYIGASSRGYNNNDSNSIVIGYSAIGIGANTVVLGNDSIVTTALKGNVGIGTTAPTSILHTVASGAKTANYSGNLLTNTATSSTASVNKYGLEVQSTGTWNGTSATNVGLYVSSVTGGTNNYDAIFNGGGNVGIGTTNPGYKLDVASDLNVSDSSEIRIGGTQVLSKGAGAYTGTLFFGDGGNSLTRPAGAYQAYFNTGLGLGSLFSITTGQMNTAGGYNSLYSNSDGVMNSAFGYNALTTNTSGSYNTALGNGSLAANSTGSSNVAIGSDTLAANTIGYYNVAIGNNAMALFNINGGYNTGVGYYALQANQGVFNSSLGAYSLASITTGRENVGIGNNSGYYNQTGSYNTIVGTGSGIGVVSNSYSNNTMIGYQTGYSTTTGGNNFFGGYQAGYGNTTGTGLVFAGYQAGYANTANYNNFIGYQAGYNTTTGQANVFLGYRSGYNNTTGANNVFLGHSVGTLNTTGGGNSVIGYLALDDNTTGDGNSGIGYGVLGYNTSGYNNNAIGVLSLEKNTTGYSNIALGVSSGRYSQTGINNIFIGQGAGMGSANYTGANNNTFIGHEAGYSITTGTSGNVFLGYQAGYSETGSNKLYVDNSNTASPLIHGDFSSNALTVNGSLTVTGTATFTGDLLPSANDTYSLGSDSMRWANAWLGAETIHVGTADADEGEIGYNTTNNVMTIGSNGNLALQASSGNVGIGTTNPVSLLHLYKLTGDNQQNIETDSGVATLVLDGNRTSDLSLGAINFQNNGVTLGGIQVNRAGGSTTGDLRFLTKTAVEGGAAVKMIIDKNGKVGIGTTNPGSKLEILGSASSGDESPIKMRYGHSPAIGDDLNLDWINYSDGLALGRIGVAADASGDWNMDFSTTTNSGSSLTQVMRLTDDGNVGIGTTDPTVKLVTMGQIRAIESTGIASIDINPATSGITLSTNYFGAGTDIPMILKTYANMNQLVLATNGNVGIGTTDPGAYKLNVAGNGYFGGSVTATDDLVLASATAELRVMESSGATYYGTIDIGDLNADATYTLAGPSGNIMTTSTESNLTGDGRHLRRIQLNAEYPGSLFSKFYGAGTDTSTTGTMTSDVESASNKLRNYFQWVSSETSSLNYYTIAVQVSLPEDFDGWATSNAIQIDYETNSSSATDNSVDVYIYNGDDTPATAVTSSTGNKSSSGATWATLTIDGTSLVNGSAPDWGTAGQTATIYLRLGSKSSNFARTGYIKLNYLSKW